MVLASIKMIWVNEEQILSRCGNSEVILSRWSQIGDRRDPRVLQPNENKLNF